MLILSHVCAEFHNAKGELIFTVRPSCLKRFMEAPDAIREDPLFQMLVNDGSLVAGITEEQKRRLENNPNAGIDASGKAVRPEPEEEEEPVKPDNPAKAAKAVKGKAGKTESPGTGQAEAVSAGEPDEKG